MRVLIVLVLWCYAAHAQLSNTGRLASTGPVDISFSSTVITDLSACGTLNSANAYYRLTQDISASGTCLSVQASGITIDLNGHTVTFGTGGGVTNRYGIVGWDCSDPDVNGNPCGGTFNSPTVKNGQIVASSACARCTYSIGIRFGGFTGANVTIHDVFINMNGTDSPNCIRTQFLSGGHRIYRNYCSSSSTSVVHRTQLDGVAIKVDNETGILSNPSDIFANHVSGFPQGGIMATSKGTKYHDNQIELNAYYTNDFGIYVWGDSQNAYNNTIDCTAGTNACRGIQVDTYTTGGTGGSSVLNNTVLTRELARNGEYGTNTDISTIARASNVVTVVTASATGVSVGQHIAITGTSDVTFIGGDFTVSTVSGATVTFAQTGPNTAAFSSGGSFQTQGCQPAGAFGIQLEVNSDGANIRSNDVTAQADACAGSALRFTSNSIKTGYNTTVSSNTFRAPRIGSTTQLANGISVDDIAANAGYTVSGNTFISDTNFMFLDFSPVLSVSVMSNTIQRGTNIDPNGWSIYYARVSSLDHTGMVFQDSTYVNGASDAQFTFQDATDGNQNSYTVKWTYTPTYTSGGNPLSGATVTIVDVLGSTIYSGTTDAAGHIGGVVLTDYVRTNNAVASPWSTKTTHNPQAVTVSKSGCTTLNYSLSITAITTESKAVTCP